MRSARGTRCVVAQTHDDFMIPEPMQRCIERLELLPDVGAREGASSFYWISNIRLLNPVTH